MDAKSKFIEFFQIMAAFVPTEVIIIILAGIIFWLWSILQKGKNDYKNLKT